MTDKYRELPEYILMDPTGNITALVTEYVKPEERNDISRRIMEKEPRAEQLGFLLDARDADIELQMAGGEFCGNATMCAAVFYAESKGLTSGTVVVKTSGADNVIPVEVKKSDENGWSGIVQMPAPVSIEDITFADGCTYPVVRFRGADHIISEYNGVLNKAARSEFEKKIKDYCRHLDSFCTGFMLYDRKDDRLDPLVYVPGIDSLFWEHSCASGTTALGAWAAHETGSPLTLSLHEPGGKLAINVTSDKKIFLTGSVRIP